MAKKIFNPNKKKNDNQSLIVNELRVQSADHSRKNLQTFKMAWIGAESITNPNRTRLYDLYHDISIDGWLEGLIDKRLNPLINKTILFKDKEGKKVDALDTLINSIEFGELIKVLFEETLWGVSGIEFIPGAKFKFNEIPRKHIKLDRKIISVMQSGGDGIAYEEQSNIWVIGKHKNLGKLLHCVPYVLWKRGSMADTSQFIEIFGQPVRVVKYDAYDTKTQGEVKKVLDESGSSLALMIPKQADFEMMDGKTTNSNGELQETFRKACNEELSVTLVGNTETTTSSSSSGYAQSKEHGEQQDEVHAKDLSRITALLNTEHFLNILQSYGFPVEGGKFEFEEEINLAKLKTKLEIDIEVAKQVPVPDDHWYETYKIAKPENYNELKALREKERQARINSSSESIEDVEYEDKPKEKGEKTRKPTPKKTPPKKVKLSAYQKLRVALADFFDHAH